MNEQGNDIKEFGNEIIETFNAIHDENQTVDRKINLLAILFGVGALHSLYGEVQISRSKSLYNEIGVDVILESVPVLIFIVGVLFFANRSKIGWAFIVGYTMFAIVGLLLFFYKAFMMSSYWRKDGLDSNGFESLIIVPVPWDNLMKSLIYASIVWFLYKKDMRMAFKISDAIGKKIVFGFCILIILVFGIMSLFY